MSERTVGLATGLVDGVAAYVSGVRAELADLPVEEVDDLTGGMEADLSELAAECGGDLAGRLGSPRRYAAELRAAAGLPERVAGFGPRRRPLTEALTRARASFTMLTEQHPGLQSVTAFLVTLRPAWWLIRGYLWAWPVWMLLGSSHGLRPQSLEEYLLALVAMLVSVQLGRGWLRQRAVMRPLLVLANGAAVVLALMALGAGEGPNYVNDGYIPPPPGLSLEGEQVTNVYAYDSDGKRITGVRLFAEDGRPLDGAQNSIDANGIPVGLDANGNPMGVVRDSSGAPLMNVYPRAVAGADPWQVTDPANPTYPAANPQLWTPPLSIVPLTPSSPATAPATATAPTPATTPTPKLVRPKSASPTPSSGPSPSVTRSGR